MTDEFTCSFQGAPGAFSHQAAMAFGKQLGADGAFVPCQTFGQVFENIAGKLTNYGAIPLENSSIGSIVANYDLLWSDDAFIIGEYFLPVHHHLIGFEGTGIEDVKTVFSHPAALDQCRRLFRDYPQMVGRVHWDTSGAVAHVKESGDRSCAAIAGELAAAQYDMNILKPNIEDFAHNSTRFGLITLASRPPAAIKRGDAPYKMSFAAELQHQAGALACLLYMLAQAGANLTKIESRPIGEAPWHYRFFIDMELGSPEVEAKVVQALQKGSQSYKTLGRYAAALYG